MGNGLDHLKSLPAVYRPLVVGIVAKKGELGLALSAREAEVLEASKAATRGTQFFTSLWKEVAVEGLLASHPTLARMDCFDGLNIAGGGDTARGAASVAGKSYPPNHISGPLERLVLGHELFNNAPDPVLRAFRAIYRSQLQVVDFEYKGSLIPGESMFTLLLKQGAEADAADIQRAAENAIKDVARLLQLPRASLPRVGVEVQSA